MVESSTAQNELKLLRTLQGAKDVKLTSCAVVPGRQQIATAAQDGSILLWPLSSGRPRPLRLGGQQGHLTCVVASQSGELLATSSTDATVAVWRNRMEKQSPVVLKVHFSPVRCCDISRDERLVLSASDDKSVKLCSIPERRFAASLIGHCNWVRSAAFSPSSTLIVSGSDDKTVRLWEPERKSCLRVWHDCGATVTCVRFSPDEGAVAASTWDSSINIWDVRSHALRQHYGRAHGGSPITEVCFHPSKDLLLSSSTDKQLRVWDLRMGRLRNTIVGHDRPVHSCSWDETGDHFASCDAGLVHYWSLLTPSTSSGQQAGCRRQPLQEQQEQLPELLGQQQASAEAVAATPAVEQSETQEPVRAATQPRATEQIQATKSSFTDEASQMTPQLLQAAWAGAPALPGAAKVQPPSFEALPETAARLMEQLVTQMDVLTSSLAALENRLAKTEAVTSEVASLLQAKRQQPLRSLQGSS